MKRKLIAILTMACVLCAMNVPVFGAENPDAESTTASAGNKVGQPKVTIKANQSYDPPLETEELVESQIHDRGGAILNANHVLWRNKVSGKENGSVNYERKTGIAKAYQRVYLDTQGTATFQDKDDNAVTRANVQDIGKHSLLLKDGTLVDLDTNSTIAEQVKTWYEENEYSIFLVKENGDVYSCNPKSKDVSRIPGLKNIMEIAKTSTWPEFLDAEGNLYELETKLNETTYRWEMIGATLVAQDVEKLIYRDDAKSSIPHAYNVKEGKTYCGDTLVLEKKAIRFVDDLFVTADKGLYTRKETDEYDENGNEIYADIRLANNFKRFTQQGYELEDGTCYDWEGNETDLISETKLHDGTYIEGTYNPTVIGTLQLKTDGCLYSDREKLLDHVTDYAKSTYGYAEDDQGTPLIITRTDGTVWLYDVAEPKDNSRECINPPQKLTEAFVESIYGKEEPPTKPTEDTKNPSGENNTGKSDQNQSPATKDQGSTAATKAKSPTKPQKVTLKKAASTKKGTLKLTWKRNTKATGYQAMVAMDKKFKKNKKTATIKKNKTVTKTFTKLKSRKTYYAKVRAYKKVGKKNVYGAYSKVKKARVK